MFSQFMAQEQSTGESMNQEQQALLDMLYEIRLNGPINSRSGICGNVAYRKCLILDELFKTWPKYSGNGEFPIQVEDEDPEAAYLYCKKMWDKSTEYGQLRWELLDHCIAQLQIQLSKA